MRPVSTGNGGGMETLPPQVLLGKAAPSLPSWSQVGWESPGHVLAGVFVVCELVYV